MENNNIIIFRWALVSVWIKKEATVDITEPFIEVPYKKELEDEIVNRPNTFDKPIIALF